MVAVIAGGVGAAKLMLGLGALAGQDQLVAVVNTGDDEVIHGLHISPDLDTVTYTLAGLNNVETGWGVVAESWRVMEELEILGGDTWFRLGDRDLATHLLRSGALRSGETLSSISARIATARKVTARLLPMTDDRVSTRLVAEIGSSQQSLSFQEYFVKHQHGVKVIEVAYDGAQEAQAAPGVLDAITQADRIVLCPSNPILSLGPIFAIKQIGDAVKAQRDRAVAVSPIVGGKAIKGPAASLMEQLGHEVSAVGIARLLAPYAATLVIDQIDADLSAAVEAAGMRCIVADTMMVDAASSQALAQVVLNA
ncbi:MAG: 2-phospho-L-lactate transferase [Actinomycetota bacterium]